MYEVVFRACIPLLNFNSFDMLVNTLVTCLDIEWCACLWWFSCDLEKSIKSIKNYQQAGLVFHMPCVLDLQPSSWRPFFFCLFAPAFTGEISVLQDCPPPKKNDAISLFSKCPKTFTSKWESSLVTMMKRDHNRSITLTTWLSVHIIRLIAVIAIFMYVFMYIWSLNVTDIMVAQSYEEHVL